VAAIAALAAIAVIVAFTFGDYGLGWDDYTHAQYGELLLNLYASGFTDTRALSFVNLYMYGGGFDMAAGLLAKILPHDLFETRRLLGAIVGIIGLAVTWRLARHVGGKLAGLIALLLLACNPIFYGHMFINAKDAPFAVAMVILLFGLIRIIEEYPRPHIAIVGLFGLGLGLSLGTRIMGGMAALYVIAPMAMLIFTDARRDGTLKAARNLGHFLLALAPGFVLAYALMALLWPWSVLEPLNPIRAVGYFSTFFEKPWREMFEGVAISVPNMPRSYIPVLFSLKMPEIFLALAIGGTICGIMANLRPSIPVRRRAVLALIVAAGILPLVIAVIIRPAMYNGIRHFTFVLPPLAILGGLAGAWLLQWLWQRGRPVAVAASLAMLGMLSLPVSAMVSLHPYQYAHFNWISGGVQHADNLYMLDYWGLAFKQASKELRRKLAAHLEMQPGAPRWRIAVCGPHPTVEVELGSKFVITWDTKDADFAMMLDEFYCTDLNAPVVVEIERDGVVFARVYDLRGRSIPDMFAVPPLNP